MSDDGHAAVELSLATGLLLLPVVLVVLSFGPWLERRVVAEAAASEAARAAVLALDEREGAAVAARVTGGHGLGPGEVRLGWCGALPQPVAVSAGSCRFERGSVVEARVEVSVPLFTTPWGEVGGLWASSTHAEPIDLYRSLR